MKFFTFAILVAETTARRPRIGLAEVPCQGKVLQRVIDFETDYQEDPFKAGDTPSRLPEGVQVTGKKFPDPSSDNDLVLFDSRSKKAGNLQTDEEGLVLIVNEKGKKKKPKSSKTGGDITLQFSEPPYSVDTIRFLNVRKNETSYVFAVNPTGERTSQIFITPGGKAKPTDLALKDVFGIRFLGIFLREPAAVARIVYSVCDESVTPSPTPRPTKRRKPRPTPSPTKRTPRPTPSPTQERNEPNLPKKCKVGFERKTTRSKNIKCRKCKKGFFSKTGRKCKPCRGNKVASRRGAGSCLRCRKGTNANAKKTKCNPKTPSTEKPSSFPTSSPSALPTTAPSIAPIIETDAPTSPRSAPTMKPTKAPRTPSPTDSRADEPSPTICFSGKKKRRGKRGNALNVVACDDRVEEKASKKKKKEKKRRGKGKRAKEDTLEIYQHLVDTES